MSDWWTYRASDFLLFAPRTWFRLIELYNAELWPAHIAVLLAGAALLALAWRGGRTAGRVIAAVLAVAWAWTAWGFHWQRYATINWAATYFAGAFALQSAVLSVEALTGRLRFGARTKSARLGLALALLAVVIWPLIGPVAGRPWAQSEVFALAPDPTALATVGFALANDRPAWRLVPLPLLWCIVSGLTLWTMGQPEAFVAPALALALPLAAAVLARRS